MMAVDALAVGAQKEGRSRTAQEWIGLIGRAAFDVTRRDRVLVGPSAASMVRCDRCSAAGHLAPVIPNRIRGDYDIFCKEAGLSATPAAKVEGYLVNRKTFLCAVANAFGVLQPESEFRQLGDDLLSLGQAWRGKRPFALIAAMSLRTENEIVDLQRRNREGFGGEPGLVLCCDRLPASDGTQGFHALCQYGDVLECSDRGLQAQQSQVRRLLGLPGRPVAKKTQTTEAQDVFQAIADEWGYVPKAQKAFRLLRERRPDLAGLSQSTLFLAKSRVTPPTPAKDSELQPE